MNKLYFLTFDYQNNGVSEMHSTYEKTHFQAYLEELLAIPSSDILVHCCSENKQLIYLEKPTNTSISVTLTPEWKRLLAFASSVHKSTDTHTLCLAIDTVSLKEHQQTPIWLVPLRYRMLKNTNKLEITFELEDAFLNPYLSLEFKKNHDASLENKELESFEAKNESIYQQLLASHYSISEVTIVGNFHHHRFLMVKELEELQTQIPSELVQSILGNENTSTVPLISFDEGNLTSLDLDQQNVIQLLEHHNLVVEGPPGTGKSELITNILGKRLTSTTSQLVVSEKKTALEVIAKKLAKNGLDPYTFLLTSETRSKDLIAKLISTWKLLEINLQDVRQPLYVGQQKRVNLQLLLDKLTAKELVGGISYSTFLGILSGKDLSNVPYVSHAPALKDWLQDVEKITKFYAQHPHINTLKYFQKKCFDSSVLLDEVIAAFIAEGLFLHELFGVSTISEIEQLLSEVVYSQIIENEVVKKQFALFKKDTTRKKFKKLYFELLKKQKELELLKAEISVWKLFPTDIQLKTWESNITNGSWWTRKKTHKQISQYLNDTNLPLLDVIQQAREFLLVKTEFSKLEIDSLNLGVQPVSSELESIYSWVIQWESNELSKLKEASKRSVEDRIQLIENNHRIKQFIENVRTFFIISPHESYLDFGQNIRATYTHSLPFSTYLNQLSTSMYGIMQQATTFDELEQLVLKSHLVQLENLFPMLRHFSGEELGRKLADIIQIEHVDQQAFVTFIHAQRAARFHAFHRILQTPNNKLAVTEKELKARLKKGKSLLVKEFAKTRHTKSIRELLNSDAKEWIELLIPIWLCTPGQVATSFPMATSFFELVIFDEASQLPLTHALGALQRSARALVCGDSKQMSPGSYFSKKTEQIDVLHHASYYWKSTTLTHHYRSQHPALIEFSNKHFYQNKLRAYPTAHQQTHPIRLHYCEEGVFVDRKNLIEAQTLAFTLENQLKNSDKSVGVVAFSQEQLTCIWEQLTIEVQEKITAQLEQGIGFFKTLEHVQGEECEQLFISIGYGKNAKGKFQLRMGPLNRRNGHRRLNVLFTRAQQNIHLFTSVKAQDFPISDNESMQLLRLYLHDAEQLYTEEKFIFPYGLQAFELNAQHVKFDSIYAAISNATELLTFHAVMTQREWKINY